MFKLTVVGTVAALAAATPINHEMVKSIRATATWEAHDVEANPLKDYSHDDLLKMLGTYIVPVNGDYLESEVVATPTDFDARTQWPSYIHPVRDQQQCGSCWAFGSSEALSDRFAIASAGKINKVLSPEDLVSCDSSDYGCGGGYLENAWKYL
jgi:cathepsin B